MNAIYSRPVEAWVLLVNVVRKWTFSSSQVQACAGLAHREALRRTLLVVRPRKRSAAAFLERPTVTMLLAALVAWRAGLFQEHAVAEGVTRSLKPTTVIVASEANDQLLYFTSTSLLSDDRRIVYLSDRGGLVGYLNRFPKWERQVIDPNHRFSTDGEVADLDGDGRQDLVVLTLGPDTVTWYRRTESRWTPQILTRQTWHDLEVADFDGDGHLDLVGRNQREWPAKDDA